METTIFEDVQYVINVALLRCKLIAAVLVMAIPVALVTLPFVSPQYEAVALLNLQEGSLSNPLRYEKGSDTKSKMKDKYMVLTRWLTSEHVLSGYLDEINKDQKPLTPKQKTGQIKGLQQLVSIEALGGSALEIKLKGGQAEGLGNRLEILISVFLERLVGPNRQVLGANQFLLETYKERVTVAERNYDKALNAMGAKSVLELKTKIDWLILKDQQLARMSSLDKPALEGRQKRQYELLKNQVTQLGDRIMKVAGHQGRAGVTLDVVKRNNARLKAARQQLKMFIAEFRSSGKSNFFDLDRLTLLGRPIDPVYGKSKKLKLAILICILFGTLAGGLVLWFEYREQRIRRSDEFAHLGNAPIIAHIPQ